MIDTLYGPVDEQVIERATKVRLLICDVDGVFSDGRIYLGNDGEELKAFHTRDGFGVKAVQHAGIEVAVITGRQSAIVQRRMSALGVAHIHQGCDDKVAVYDQLRAQLGLEHEQCAYIGDDLVDLAVMKQVGLAVAVEDAHPALLPHAHFRTRIRGGFGAVRELCDLLLQAQGKLAQAKGMSV
ncbi:3-deoxy-D-manno-octulosonate 8-phosphate phosphatase, YrbI family [Ferrimonas balearica DSM 9799]|uniref:3-deoxy-D-manno-octulosonate 8-phosphate phosphatase KdsC n=1 Tax=Ferrimonas balearica (strain DSM 9799 / CCM 4581 / KCTC 23876 / PAT) TaxID=550540 RepID=E1SMC7_FERBD|nr:3-deoxy-manno-octulosonate-8-phosphatase KdsC [Ferrimonas balearica]ADN77636.1 3-deoxy-D-manno-octulosonate 8-phosphate phosphatase, YrbI family [Ferrimonas balearica DSM 9799]MBW3141001.1 3-deoxy-manno-octulosonate-8-phosphatase KdsC [Ferrimonas balearica]MBW3165799.1 3-deoxy-manno-octulosonate-8-phosphatase KdsC [Ferrimonas balearica]MBY5981709.1 3-deoxy-manno-octulosonate-8-phosphatase KdsC [Ferrimonas balearica]MBY6107975.1 3-deoxy-manno-octulosonate-8-phosphatase KdsC [Ferrimonas balea